MKKNKVRRRVKVPQKRSRLGAIAVNSAICMIPILLFVALVVDVGVIGLTNGQLQQVADATAISAAQSVSHTLHPTTLKSDYAKATDMAHQIARLSHMSAKANGVVLRSSDIEFLSASYNATTGKYTIGSAPGGMINAVKIRVHRDQHANSPLMLGFSRLAGKDQVELSRYATAAFFPADEIGEGAEILPIAVDATVWTAMRMGNSITNKLLPSQITSLLDNIDLFDVLAMTLGKKVLDPLGVPFDLAGNPLMIMDRQAYVSSNQTIVSGTDGVWEGIFLPHQLERTLSIFSIITNLTGIKYIPGNMAVIDIGKQASSSKLVMNIARLERQLVDGLDVADVAGINSLNGRSGTTLKTPFTVPGQYYLPKELKQELTDSIGKPRILFLYATIPGVLTTVQDILQQPTQFVIVGWVGAVVTEVNFHSTLNYVKIQPAVYHSFKLGKGSGTGNYSSGVLAGPYLIE